MIEKTFLEALSVAFAAKAAAIRDDNRPQVISKDGESYHGFTPQQRLRLRVAAFADQTARDLAQAAKD